jgi:hypothetical protein
MELRSGDTPTTEIGYTNRNGQMNLVHRFKPGADHGQRAYKLVCQHCGHEYGANGTDIHLRKFPNCQDGRPGIEY